MWTASSILRINEKNRSPFSANLAHCPGDYIWISGVVHFKKVDGSVSTPDYKINLRPADAYFVWLGRKGKGKTSQHLGNAESLFDLLCMEQAK